MSKRSPFRYIRTSPEIIRLAVMIHMRFPLSLRNVEDPMHECGIEMSHETVRFWWQRFGSMFAAEIRKKRVAGLRSSRWSWHLDEVFVKINGVQHYLWRAVDHESEVLKSYVTKHWDQAAALRSLKKLMKRHSRAAELVTDGLKSYGAALKGLGAEDKQVIGRWANNRAENSHLPFRRLERAILRFWGLHSLQRFVSVHSSVFNLFNSDRSLSSRDLYKAARLPLSPSGGSSARAEVRRTCRISDEFACVRQHLQKKIRTAHL